MTDLIQCPFCWESEVECGQTHDGPVYRVECMCGACGPEGRTEQEAIDAWNRRNEQSEIDRLRERLSEALDALSALESDSQHTDHHCGDSECPVDRAREVLFKHGRRDVPGGGDWLNRTDEPRFDNEGDNFETMKGDTT